MRFGLLPGNSLAVRINSHREGWAGTICSSPENWNCLARSEFRADYCANGDARCFHIHAFDPADPRIVIERNGAEWLLRDHPDALDDQILFLWGYRATGERGIPDTDRRSILFGAYRVRHVELEHPQRGHWSVRPYPDGWMRIADANIRAPRHETTGGMYINQFDAHDVERILESPELFAGLKNPDDVASFRAFAKGYRGWVAQAKSAAEKVQSRFPDEPEHAGAARHTSHFDVGIAHKPMKGLADLMSSRNIAVHASPAAGASLAAGAARGAVPTPMSSSPPGAAAARAADAVRIEPESEAWIRATFGADMLIDLQVAFATRELVVFRGDPGVGKSHLALRLIDDPNRERTLVLPVSATWRGREDLLGYVNPIHGRFEKTSFTQFLEKAAEAWKRGDARARVVVFEEFNLSQPEHWLADVLSVSQHEHERDRVLRLAGDGASGANEVFLSPALRFIATINSDHTTRPLSPRVLDRAAVVSLEMTAKEALRRANVTLDESSIKAVADLDFLLRGRGASFSIRSARALARCIELGFAGGQGEALDLVLVQQVLSKVRLQAHDPGDLALLRDVGEWCEQNGAGMVRCAAVISSWKERIDNGFDVFQA